MSETANIPPVATAAPTPVVCKPAATTAPQSQPQPQQAGAAAPAPGSQKNFRRQARKKH